MFRSVFSCEREVCVCLSNYYDTITQSCQACPRTCSSCIHEDSCLTCVAGFVMNQDFCVSCEALMRVDLNAGMQHTECLHICGDGRRIQEQCDDGNLVDGDGCSSSCTIESEYICSGGSAVSKDLCVHLDVFRPELELASNTLTNVILFAAFSQPLSTASSMMLDNKAVPFKISLNDDPSVDFSYNYSFIFESQLLMINLSNFTESTGLTEVQIEFEELCSILSIFGSCLKYLTASISVNIDQYTERQVIPGHH